MLNRNLSEESDTKASVNVFVGAGFTPARMHKWALEFSGGHEARPYEDISSFLASFHPETLPRHSEPFDRLRTGSAKNLRGSSNYEILRRPASAGLLRMTSIKAVSGWALAMKKSVLVTLS